MLKYTLTIEGTEKELELHKRVGLEDYLIPFQTKTGTAEYRGVISKVEYKVVEPLRVEYEATINKHRLINLITPDPRLKAHAFKKIKVVITEEI